MVDTSKLLFTKDCIYMDRKKLDKGNK